MKKVVIFDFDGVIVNTLDFSFEINKSYNPALLRSDWENMHKGESFYSEFNRPDGPIKNPVDDFFREYEKWVYGVPPYKGIKDSIVKLSKKYELVIVSGSPATIIKKYLEKYDMGKYFKSILGTETHLDKTHKLTKIMELYGLQTKDCILVTDTVCDLREANKVNVSAIANTWGVFNEEILSEEKPFAIVKTPSELEKTIDSFFSS